MARRRLRRWMKSLLYRKAVSNLSRRPWSSRRRPLLRRNSKYQVHQGYLPPPMLFHRGRDRFDAIAFHEKASRRLLPRAARLDLRHARLPGARGLIRTEERRGTRSETASHKVREKARGSTGMFSLKRRTFRRAT